ncbi:hypothetical protein [Bacillus sp. EB01]|uniref:hypothetical protein n=1 Tax=Bacillus sp. EB01 TaxID=1347086 RepID=UPI0005C61757|nr:hypothetical protein [Bacillus sp. EB01]
MKGDNKPFNDVIDHFNEIEVNAGNPANNKINKLPKPLKYIGYFMIGFISLSILLMFFLNLFN